MTIASTAGWFVVHVVWIGAVISGLVAVLLTSLGDRRARLRHALAYAGLMLTILLPLAITLGTVDFFSRAARMQATDLVERAIGMPTFVVWRGYLVRGAAIVWGAGLVIVIIRVATAQRRAATLRRTDTTQPDASLRQMVERLRADLGVTRPVTVLASRLAAVPMVFGWRESTILLPVGASRDLNTTQLAAVLAHELAHVRRCDYALNLVQVAADVMLWFHPAARWLSRRVRIEREYCCDDVAVPVAHDPRDYARALATLEDARHDGSVVVAVVAAVAATSGTLLDRIQRVVGEPRPVLTPVRATAALALAIAIGGMVVALAQIVPPALPLDVRLRSRTPPPADTRMPASAPLAPRVPRR
jgi:beta-lactamase regulating signal transducer with metallopeptidase domain